MSIVYQLTLIYMTQRQLYFTKKSLWSKLLCTSNAFGFFYQGFNYDTSFIVSWPEACSTEWAPVSVAKFLYTNNTTRERSLYAEHTLGINFVSRQSMTHLRRKTKSLLATSLFLVDQKRPKEMLAGRVQRPLKKFQMNSVHL